MESRIVAASLTLEHLELIKDDGTSFYVKQGHPQLQELVDKVLPIVSTGKVVVLDLDEIYVSRTVYHEVSEKSGGLIKFFRVAKDKLKGLFKSDAPEEHVFMDTHAEATSEKAQEVLAAMAQKPQEKLAKADEDHTIVAIVGDKIIPGMEKLDAHFKHALTKLGNTIGIENFLRRAASVMADRPHSLEDLLTFMEKADLPIADDGSIIVYKGLNQTSEEGTFVDCHSRKVTQRVGSKVFMSPDLVDWSRDNNCSHGLHIARKGYLRNFPSNVITLCKVNPEDVIVVPKYDPSKMRVCAYHILGVLSHEAAGKVKSCWPFDDLTEDAQLLAKAISGNHIGITETVEICGPKGTNLKITNLDTSEPVQEEAFDSTLGSNVAEIDTEETQAEKVDVMETARKVTQQTQPKPTLSRAEEIQKLVELWKNETDYKSRKDTLINLIDLKRASKKSFTALGVSDADAKRLMEAAKNL